jgi:hypothetical protein
LVSAFALLVGQRGIGDHLRLKRWTPEGGHRVEIELNDIARFGIAESAVE